MQPSSIRIQPTLTPQSSSDTVRKPWTENIEAKKTRKLWITYRVSRKSSITFLTIYIYPFLAAFSRSKVFDRKLSRNSNRFSGEKDSALNSIQGNFRIRYVDKCHENDKKYYIFSSQRISYKKMSESCWSELSRTMERKKRILGSIWQMIWREMSRTYMEAGIAFCREEKRIGRQRKRKIKILFSFIISLRLPFASSRWNLYFRRSPRRDPRTLVITRLLPTPRGGE